MKLKVKTKTRQNVVKLFSAEAVISIAPNFQ